MICYYSCFYILYVFIFYSILLYIDLFFLIISYLYILFVDLLPETLAFLTVRLVMEIGRLLLRKAIPWKIVPVLVSGESSLVSYVPKGLIPYGGWKKSCITLDGWNPLNSGKNNLSTGAGFLPSTVAYKNNYRKTQFFHT